MPGKEHQPKDFQAQCGSSKHQHARTHLQSLLHAGDIARASHLDVRRRPQLPQKLAYARIRHPLSRVRAAGGLARSPTAE